jgi:hypothetical protein
VSRFYFLYGLTVLGLLAAGEYRGYTFSRVTEIKNVPNSVRDNPGSYRSAYAGYHHYVGGK